MSQNINREQQELDAAEQLIDRATAQMREAQPDPKVVEAAAARVWQQLSCRGIKLVQEGDPARPRPWSARPSAGLSRFASFRGLALAATVVVAAGAAYFFGRDLLPSGPLGTVEAVDGQLFHVASVSHLPVQVGARVSEGEVLRTSRDGGAEIRLADGSTVEMSPRAEISIEDGHRGTTVHLERGSVIVHAAKQRDRHLYVATEDCLVSVTGTIFSVNHGTKGSRVSVVEGEVHVDHKGDNAVLHPGDQVTTAYALAKVPVDQEISWSRDVDDYLKLLKELEALRKEIDQRVPHADLRYDSRLLDLMPADTLFYAAMPNVPETLGRMHEVLQERLAQSPALSEWWAAQDADMHRHFEQAFGLFTELGAQLGTEVAAGVHFTPDEEGGVVLLAEVRDQAGLRALIDRELAQVPGEARGHLVLVENPATTTATPDAIYLWLKNDLAVGSSDLAHLQSVARFLEGETNPSSPPSSTPASSALYAEGAEFLVAGNIHDVVVAAHAKSGADAEAKDFSAAGFDNVKHLVLEQKKVGANTQHRAMLTFSGERQGVFSWLAAPAPMGSLGFLSPEAKLVVAAVLKDPAQLFDEIGRLSEGGLPAELAAVRADLRPFGARRLHGHHRRRDRPGARRPAGAQAGVEDGARGLRPGPLPVGARPGADRGQPPARRPAANRRSRSTAMEKGGRTFFTVPAGAFTLHYTFAEGYLLMASDVALLDQALRYRSSGYSIATAQRFLALLPEDGRANLLGGGLPGPRQRARPARPAASARACRPSSRRRSRPSPARTSPAWPTPTANATG